jgi:hypothetical protein
MRAAAGLSVLGIAGALLVVALFFGHGSSDERLFWIGIVASLAALGLIFATLVGFLPRPAPTKHGWWALGLFAAFVLWNGLTILWSIAPDRSWSYLNRGLAYLALAVLGLYAGALVRRRPVVTTAGLLAALFLGVLGWALLGKVFPGLFPDGARVARLRNPIGYWNALALVAALALPLGLWLAAGRRHARLVRAGGVVLLYLAPIALAGGHRGGGGRRRALALALPRPLRGAADARCRCRAGAGRRRVGGDAARPRRPSPDVRDARAGRRVVRTRSRARRGRRARSLALRHTAR